MQEETERISCLMVTRPCAERFALFQRSVACFLAQTHPNRELVVVLDDGPAAWGDRVRAHLAGLPGGAVVVPPAGKRPLGALRNLSVAAASGAVLCQWDDDDLSHPHRLAEQYALLRRAGVLAVTLEELLHFFAAARQLYWLNFLRTSDGCHAGTVMFRRATAARYPQEGPASRRGEDSAFLASLRREGEVVALAGMPHLYVYVYHETNTYDGAHHRMLAKELSLSRGLLLRRRAVFDNLACLDLGGQPLDVMGSNGPAFQVPGRGPGSVTVSQEC